MDITIVIDSTCAYKILPENNSMEKEWALVLPFGLSISPPKKLIVFSRFEHMLSEGIA